MITKHYKNLSTGLEFTDIKEDGFCRFQSSHLEGGHWQRFLNSVPDDILYNLAIGNHVVIYDCGSRRHDGCSRVIWQGLPFLRYVFMKCWLNHFMPISLVKSQNCADLFYAVYHRLDLRRIKYYRKHITVDCMPLNIFGKYKKSLLDGKCDVTQFSVDTHQNMA